MFSVTIISAASLFPLSSRFRSKGLVDGNYRVEIYKQEQLRKMQLLVYVRYKTL
jgi:hypothetical protein